jgi:two-component system phosphate regulon sensor histidine kinase PhoR
MENTLRKEAEKLPCLIHGRDRGRSRKTILWPLQIDDNTATQSKADEDYNVDASLPATEDKTSSESSENPELEILEVLRATAHDIRGPLVNVAAGLKLMCRGSFGPLVPSVRKELEKLFMASTKLIGTLEDSLGRTGYLIDGTAGFSEELNLKTDVLDPVIDELKTELREHGAVFYNTMDSAIPEELMLKGDRFWLKVVFRNLIGNALKYGGEGVKIAIRFKGGEKFFQFDVCNSGITVPEKDRDHLFAKFARMSEDPQKNSSGLGLGLYMVREIIRKQGGEIWYEPRVNGSSFVFTLPRN